MIKTAKFFSIQSSLSTTSMNFNWSVQSKGNSCYIILKPLTHSSLPIYSWKYSTLWDPN